MVVQISGGGDYTSAPKKTVGWDIGTGSARTTGGTPMTKPVSWDIGTGTARTTGTTAPRLSSPVQPLSNPAYNPAPAPAPSYGYDLPANTPIPNSSNYGAPSNYGAQQAPAAPPAPPVGGRQWYSQLDAGGQAQANKDWLGGDSDYSSQIAEYDRALQTFIERIANQKKMFNQDADDAVASTGRNQAMSLDALGEDFGARGLSYSGLYKTENSRTNDRFNEAKGNVEKVRSRNLQDADNREADYRTENTISRGNAERSSLSRQAQRQALIDSMAGF